MGQRLRGAADGGTATVVMRPAEAKDAPPPAEWGPDTAVDGLADPKLIYHRERTFTATSACVAADGFYDRCMAFCRAEGIDPDSVIFPLEVARLWVETNFLLRGAFPWLYAQPDDERPVWRPHNAFDVEGDRLSVREPERSCVDPDAPEEPKRPPLLLPGCQGPMSDGSACPHLRRHGHRYCSEHEAVIRREIRKGRA